MEIDNFELISKVDRFQKIVDQYAEDGNEEKFEKKITHWIKFEKHYPDLVTVIAADIFGTTSKKLRSKNRKEEIVDARKMCLYYFTKQKKAIFAIVGRYYGKDHSTVHHAKRTFLNLIQYDKDLKDKFHQFQAKLLEYQEYL